MQTKLTHREKEKLKRKTGSSFTFREVLHEFQVLTEVRQDLMCMPTHVHKTISVVAARNPLHYLRGGGRMESQTGHRKDSPQIRGQKKINPWRAAEIREGE